MALLSVQKGREKKKPFRPVCVNVLLPKRNQRSIATCRYDLWFLNIQIKVSLTWIISDASLFFQLFRFNSLSFFVIQFNNFSFLLFSIEHYQFLKRFNYDATFGYLLKSRLFHRT